MAKRALITGITGQDGAYLARLLLDKGYDVFGAVRRTASINSWRLEEAGVADRVQLVELDMLEFSNILRVVEKVGPDEVYNLAAQSFVALRSSNRSTRRALMASALRCCSRPFVLAARTAGSIRPPPPRCSAR